MALVNPIKKGGRYTVKEQEERRIQVYHLHFEENRSAVKISELLDVNRNTINGDIAYWHSHLAHEFNAQNIPAKMTKQIQRIEMQRDRLLDFLEDASLDEKFKIEKFISDIDNKLMQYYSKMIQSGMNTLEPTVKVDDIDENEIKELVRGLIFSEGAEEMYSENELKFYFIRKTKCDVNHAERLLAKIMGNGLILCKQDKMITHFPGSFYPSSETYNLEKFAGLRGYVTTNELLQIIQKRAKIEADIEKTDEIEEKLIQKHGDKSEWPEWLLEKFESGELDESILLE